MQERKLAELNVLAHFLLFCCNGSTLDENKAGERKGAANRHLSDLQRTATPTVSGFVSFPRGKKLVRYLI